MLNTYANVTTVLCTHNVTREVITVSEWVRVITLWVRVPALKTQNLSLIPLYKKMPAAVGGTYLLRRQRQVDPWGSRSSPNSHTSKVQDSEIPRLKIRSMAFLKNGAQGCPSAPYTCVSMSACSGIHM